MPSLMQGSGHIKMQQPKNVFHYYFTRCPGKGAVFGFFLGALITSIFLDETSIWTLSQRWMNSLNSSARQKFTSPIVTISGSLNSQQMNHPSSLTREFAITTSGNDEPSKAIGSFQVRQTTQRTSEIAGGNDEDTLKNVLLDQWASFYVKQVNSSNSQHLNIQYANSSFLEPIHPPHMRNCRDYTKKNKRLDSRFINGKRPRWSLWKGLMGIKLGNSIDPEDTGEEMLFNKKGLVEGPYPPWVKGADEDNLPRTRRVQRDLWVKQHPRNCSDPQLKFLIADWETDPGYGIGAQIAAMIGLLAIAMNENRILVTGYFNRADHEGCVGPKRSHWSCYFLPETSNECRTRALEIASRNQSWELGIITSKEQYNSKRIWSGKIPQHWGKAWKQMQPTTEVDGELLLHHQATDRRWWRAQALRYLMRYPSQHMCVLMNDARHRAFGAKAAEMVLQSMTLRQSKVSSGKNSSSIETYVWSDYDPWTPKPLISIHVRQGDKASEMKVVGLEKYMELAQRLRERFPNAKDVWLSTEMQDIVEESTRTPSWNFYFTNITRQHGDTGMATYEAGLGREDCSNNAFVNFLMAAEADYFIGALGSTWCFLIDGMRSTGGKVMAGYLSVNKDRFW